MLLMKERQSKDGNRKQVDEWMTYWRKVSTTDRGTLLIVAILVVIVQVSSSLSVCFGILHNFQINKKKCREACLDIHFAVLSLLELE